MPSLEYFFTFSSIATSNKNWDLLKIIIREVFNIYKKLLFIRLSGIQNIVGGVGNRWRELGDMEDRMEDNRIAKVVEEDTRQIVQGLRRPNNYGNVGTTRLIKIKKKKIFSL